MAFGVTFTDHVVRVVQVEASTTAQLVDAVELDLPADLVVDGRVRDPGRIGRLLRPMLRGQVVVAEAGGPETRLVPAAVAHDTGHLRRTVAEDGGGTFTGTWCRDRGAGEPSALALAAADSVEALARSLMAAEASAIAVDVLPLALLRVGAFRAEFLTATTLVEWSDSGTAWWATTTDGWPTAGGRRRTDDGPVADGLWVTRHGEQQPLADLGHVGGLDGTDATSRFAPTVGAALAALDDRLFPIDLRMPDRTFEAAAQDH